MPSSSTTTFRRRRAACAALLALLLGLCLPAGAVQAAGGEARARAKAIAGLTKRLAAAEEAKDRNACARIGLKLGGLQAASGAYREARRLLRGVLHWAKSARDEPMEAAACATLGIVCESLGDYRMGLAYLVRSLELARKLKQPRCEAASLGALGVIQLRLGEHRAALSHLEEALRKRIELHDRRGEAATRANMGIAHLAMGEYKVALQHFRQAMAIQEELGRRVDKARTLTDIAGAYERLGAYRTAADYLEQARVLCEATAQRADLAAVLTGLGNVEVLLGDYASAIRRHERAIEILKDLGLRQRYAAALGDLGAIYESLGGAERALALHKQALDVFVAIGDRAGEVAGLRRVGALYDRLGQHARALEALERALGICRELGDDEAEALVVASLGNAYMADGRLAAAQARQEQALAKARRLGARDLEASTLGNLGLVHLKRGDVQGALEIQAEALALARDLGLRRTVVLNRWGIALARLEQGDAAAASEQVRLAAEEIDASVAGLDDVAGPDAREVWAGLFDAGVLASAELDDVEQAFACMERGRARSLLDALGGRGTVAALTLPRELAEAEAHARARERRALLAHRAARRRGKLPEIRRLGRELERAREAVAAVVVRAQREARAAADIVYPSPPALAAVREHVGEGEVLLIYALVGARSFAVVVTATGARLVDLGSAAAIRAACEDLRPDDTGSAATPAAVRLRKLVVEPLKLPPGTRRVLVSPHDVLSYVPVTLLVPGVDIAYVPSAASYLLLRAQDEVRGEEVLALGDPAYRSVRRGRRRGGRLSGRPLARLPATSKEARAVGDKVLLGRDATVPTFFEVLATHERWRAVHFACHGIVDPERPFQSALALTPDAASDGYLTALDVLGRSIPADLTVLSGCETGRGRLYRAEGIVGLTRAFMFAGSPRILCSLWKVDDEATRALMERFYRLWNPKQGAGIPAATALRRAQESIRAQKKWRHPYYWAAWVLWGLPE